MSRSFSYSTKEFGWKNISKHCVEYDQFSNVHNSIEVVTLLNGTFV